MLRCPEKSRRDALLSPLLPSLPSHRLRGSLPRNAEGATRKAARKKPPVGGSADRRISYSLTWKDSDRVVITPQSFSIFSPIDLADLHLLCPWHTL